MSLVSAHKLGPRVNCRRHMEYLMAITIGGCKAKRLNRATVHCAQY
jgi:hypothetical protein